MHYVFYKQSQKHEGTHTHLFGWFQLHQLLLHLHLHLHLHLLLHRHQVPEARGLLALGSYPYCSLSHPSQMLVVGLLREALSLSARKSVLLTKC